MNRVTLSVYGTCRRAGRPHAPSPPAFKAPLAAFSAHPSQAGDALLGPCRCPRCASSSPPRSPRLLTPLPGRQHPAGRRRPGAAGGFRRGGHAGAGRLLGQPHDVAQHLCGHALLDGAGGHGAEPGVSAGVGWVGLGCRGALHCVQRVCTSGWQHRRGLARPRLRRLRRPGCPWPPHDRTPWDRCARVPPAATTPAPTSGRLASRCWSWRTGTRPLLACPP